MADLKQKAHLAIQKFGMIASPNKPGDISAELQKIATHETALYVKDHMSNVHSVLDWQGVHDIAISKVDMEGMVLEFGVYSAMTTNYIAERFPNRKVHGFDSFEGLPEFWRDGYDKGVFGVDALPEVRDNIELHKGWFDESIPPFIENVVKKEKVKDIAYLHVDCDLYSSTKTIFDLLGDRIVPGTVIVFDEYFNYTGWEKGEFLAFKEFLAGKELGYSYLTYCSRHEQAAVIIEAK